MTFKVGDKVCWTNGNGVELYGVVVAGKPGFLTIVGDHDDKPRVFQLKDWLAAGNLRHVRPRLRLVDAGTHFETREVAV